MANKIYNQDKLYAGNFSLNYFDGLLIGSVTTYAGDNIPAGYLECDGRAVSRATYDELFLAIGEKYGAGDGSTTFNLPSIIDLSSTAFKYIIKAKVDSTAINNATNSKKGFVRFATDAEAEFSVMDDVAINPKQLKLAVSKADASDIIYGTDADGKQKLYDKMDFCPKAIADVPPTILKNPSGVSGPVWYQVRNNMVSIQLDGAYCSGNGTIYLFSDFPSYLLPNKGKQFCVPAVAFDSQTYIPGFWYANPSGIRLKSKSTGLAMWATVSYMLW